jgi:hypothetical protein
LWGKNDNDGDRKCTGEGCGGLVTGVDERQVTWPHTEESEGGKRRGEHGSVEWLFEAEAARQRRGGVRGWSPRGGRERGRERGPWVWQKYRAMAPADRRARAAQSARFNSV